MIDHGPTVVYYVTGAVLQIKPITLVNSTGEYVRDKILATFYCLPRRGRSQTCCVVHHPQIP
jgi:hypothetical protein